MSAVIFERYRERGEKLTFEFRLYAWSIIADPVLFFVVSDQDSTGVNLTLGRILQVVFLTYFFLRLSLRNVSLNIPNPWNPAFRNFTIYILFLLGSSLLGLFVFDSYKLANEYRIEYSSWLVEAVRGKYSRPLFELVILLYYLIYYAVLPKYLIRSQEQFQYLFKWLIRTFYFMLCIGIVDVISNYFGGWYIPKHSVYTEFGYVGERFHAFLGEPRDAFPYLLFGLAVIYLRSTLVPNTKLPRSLLPLTVLALVLTQSVSGVIGVAVGALGMLFYLSIKSFKVFVRGLVGTAFVVAFIGFMFSLSPRLMDYWVAFSGVWATLNAGTRDLPYLVEVQSSNFLPFWEMWLNLKALNLVPVFVGQGLGSTSFVNNNLMAIFIEDAGSSLMNSNAQITRILFETGVIGFLVYLNVFINPVRKLLLRYPAHRGMNFTLFVFMLGASLAHRHTAIFVYLGIVIAILANWPYRQPPQSNAAARH